jgi:hypothetical protein
MPAAAAPPNVVPAGLCETCKYAKRIESDRGSAFLLCQLALTDRRFTKYPRLPVLSCSGYQRRDRAVADGLPADGLNS